MIYFLGLKYHRADVINIASQDIRYVGFIAEYPEGFLKRRNCSCATFYFNKINFILVKASYVREAPEGIGIASIASSLIKRRTHCLGLTSIRPYRAQIQEDL